MKQQPGNSLQILNTTRHVIRAAAAASAALAIAACTSVPGETVAGRSVQRDVRERIMGLARANDPGCRDPRILTTEILDVYSDGRSSEELWVTEQCGRRVSYVVSFPAKKGAPGFRVRPER